MPRLMIFLPILWAFLGLSLASQRQESSQSSQESQDLLETPRARSARRRQERTRHLNAQTLMGAPEPVDGTPADQNPLLQIVRLPPRISRSLTVFLVETQAEEETVISETEIPDLHETVTSGFITEVGGDSDEEEEVEESISITADQPRTVNEEYYFQEEPENQEYYDRLQEERAIEEAVSSEVSRHGLYRTFETSAIIPFHNHFQPLQIFKVDPSDTVLMNRIKKRVFIKPQNGTWGRYTDPISHRRVYFSFPFYETADDSPVASQESSSFDITDYLGDYTRPVQAPAIAAAAPERPVSPVVRLTRSSYDSPSLSKKREASFEPPPVKRTRLDHLTDVVSHFNSKIPTLKGKSKSRLLPYLPHLNDLLSNNYDHELTEKMVLAFEFKFEQVFFPALELFKDTTLLLQGCLLSILEDVDFEKFHRLRGKFSFNSIMVSQNFERRLLKYIFKLQQTSPSASNYLMSPVNAPFLFNHLCDNEGNQQVGKFCLDTALKSHYGLPVSPRNMIHQGIIHALRTFEWDNFGNVKLLRFYPTCLGYIRGLFDSEEEYYSYIQGLMSAVKVKFSCSSKEMNCVCDNLLQNNLVKPFIKHSVKTSNLDTVKTIYSLITAEMTALKTIDTPRVVRVEVINDHLFQLIIEDSKQSLSLHRKTIVLPRYHG